MMTRQPQLAGLDWTFVTSSVSPERLNTSLPLWRLEQTKKKESAMGIDGSCSSESSGWCKGTFVESRPGLRWFIASTTQQRAEEDIMRLIYPLTFYLYHISNTERQREREMEFPIIIREEGRRMEPEFFHGLEMSHGRWLGGRTHFSIYTHT